MLLEALRELINSGDIMIIEKKIILPVFIIIYFMSFIIWPASIRAVVYIMVLSYTASFFLNKLYNKYNFSSLEKISILVYFFTVIVHSLFFFQDIEQATYGLYEYFFYPLIFFCALSILPRLNDKIITYIFIVMSIITVAVEQYQSLVQNLIFLDGTSFGFVSGYSFFRSTGLSESPMACGMLTAIYFIYFLFECCETKEKKWIAMCLLNLYGLYITNSRGPLISLLLALVLAMTLRSCGKSKNKMGSLFKLFFVLVTMLGLSYIVLVNNFLSDEILARFMSVGDFEENEANVGRVIYWLMSINMFTDNMQNFLFGIGLARTGALGPAVLFPTESGVLKKLVEGGIILAFVFYFMVTSMFIRGVKSAWTCKEQKNEKKLCFAITVIIIIFIEEFTLQIMENISVSFFFWSAFALAKYCELMERSE